MICLYLFFIIYLIFDRFSIYENEITRFSHIFENESVMKEYKKSIEKQELYCIFIQNNS